MFSCKRKRGVGAFIRAHQRGRMLLGHTAVCTATPSKSFPSVNLYYVRRLSPLSFLSPLSSCTEEATFGAFYSGGEMMIGSLYCTLCQPVPFPRSPLSIVENPLADYLVETVIVTCAASFHD